MNDETHRIHYGWVIGLTGMGVLFACLGLGRFALGMMLPSMGLSLELNYSQMGIIGTGNFVGYMASVILAGMVTRRIGARATIAMGLLLVGLTMIFISRAGGFYAVVILYAATGLGSGLANVPMMGLVSHWFLSHTRGRAAGAMLTGNGLAIVFAGMFIPWVNAAPGGEGWRTGWMVIGGICLVIAAIAAAFIRNTPEQMGVRPMGSARGGAAATIPQSRDFVPWRSRAMIHLGCIYTLFGATYVVYATFIVTAMVTEYGFGEGTAGNFWAAVGALSIVSGPLFGWISDRMGRRPTMMGVYALFTLSYALVAADLPEAFLFASIAIFGLAVWSIPTIMSATVGDYAGPAGAVRAFGFITLFFGAGQITGPAVAGVLADATGSFRMAFWMCAALTAGAVALTFFLRPPDRSGASGSQG